MGNIRRKMYKSVHPPRSDTEDRLLFELVPIPLQCNDPLPDPRVILTEAEAKLLQDEERVISVPQVEEPDIQGQDMDMSIEEPEEEEPEYQVQPVIEPSSVPAPELVGKSLKPKKAIFAKSLQRAARISTGAATTSGTTVIRRPMSSGGKLFRSAKQGPLQIRKGIVPKKGLLLKKVKPKPTSHVRPILQVPRVEIDLDEPLSPGEMSHFHNMIVSKPVASEPMAPGAALNGGNRPRPLGLLRAKKND
jgi:hypothetical protein